MTIFRITISFLVSLAFTNLALAQYDLKSEKDLAWYNKTPKESIHFTVNSNTLITGETLYYKVLCKNAQSQEISSLSNIAYVELQNENGVVFQHKLILKNGAGESLFNISKDLPSGHYKLLGYTHWMKNNGPTFHNEKNLIIINPTEGLLFSDKPIDSNLKKESLSNNDLISIETDAPVYAKRSKVVLKVNSDDINVKLGNYAISVSKVNHLDALFSSNNIPLTAPKIASNFNNKTIGDAIFLAETEGEIISGKVSEKSSKKPIVNTRVMLSILDDSAFQDFAITNSEGLFTFTLKNSFKSDKAFIQTIEDEANNALISFNTKTLVNNNSLQFKNITISKKFKEIIRKRSIASQIETAYSQLKKNDPIVPKYSPPFYGNYEAKFVLDDYKRFPTLAETLIEVVEHAWHERYNGKVRAINVRERENDPYYDVNILPLVVYDGAYIKDHAAILPENANTIESISVFRDEFYYGSKVYQGALMVKSKDRNYYQTLVRDNAILIDLLKPQFSHNYFKENYSVGNTERIPDYRKDLLWLPNYIFSSENNEVYFYTSDQKELYRISLEGTTKNGIPIYLEKEIVIE